LLPGPTHGRAGSEAAVVELGLDEEQAAMEIPSSRECPRRRARVSYPSDKRESESEPRSRERRAPPRRGNTNSIAARNVFFFFVIKEL